MFNADGVLTATNSPYSNFVLSEDPEDQSYAFRALLQGVEYIVQEPMPEEVSGELRQYIGVTLRNADNEADGFVQLSMRPERLETLLSSVQIDTILDGVKLGQGGFAFAVNKADGTFAYYPDEKLVGTSATSAGLDESQLKGNFSDFLTIGGTDYYASSFETDDYYVYVAQPESELMTDRVPLTLATGANGIICQIVIFLLVTFEIRRKQGEVVAAGEEADDDEPNRTIETTMPSGRRAKTESAASRWIYRSMHWGDKSAEQRVLTVLKVLMGIFAIAVCVAVVFQDRVFPKDSVFSYVLSGNWEYGLNVFAVTAALMIACVVLTITMMIQALLRMLSDVFGAREFYKATLAEQLRADRFNDEKKEAAKDMGNEEYEADDSRK